MPRFKASWLSALFLLFSFYEVRLLDQQESNVKFRAVLLYRLSLSCLGGLVFHVLQFSSVQFKMVSMRMEKPINYTLYPVSQSSGAE